MYDLYDSFQSPQPLLMSMYRLLPVNTTGSPIRVWFINQAALAVLMPVHPWLAFVRPKDAPLEAAFAVDPCSAPAAAERQGEAVGFAADGKSYFTISEGAGAPIHHFVAR